MATFEHPSPPSGPPERPEGLGPVAEPAAAWKPLTAFVALAAAFLAVLTIGLIVSVFAAGFGADLEAPPAGVNIALTGIQGALFVAAAFFFAQLVSVPRARDFGLRRPAKAWLAVALVPAVYLAFILVSAIWVAVLGEDADNDLPEELGAEDSDIALVAVMVLVTVVAPIGEEFLFRGYMFRALRNWKGVAPAAVLSGAVFGGIHVLSADAVALFPLAVLGVGMALIYHWTGSLYSAIGLHALNNAIAFGVSQDWDWQIPLVIVGAVAGSLTVAWLLARAIDAARGRILARAQAARPGAP